ncbi:hypothetical protein BCR36DRAFT_305717, partial [Piromyces finnis]
CKNRNGFIGICIEKNTCITRGGHYEDNNCPNDGKSIKCCDSIPCKKDNVEEQCMFKHNSIDNKYSEFKDLCPGESDFLCYIEKPKVIYLKAKENIGSNV